MGERAIREVEVFEGEGSVLGDLGFQSGGFFEERDGDFLGVQGFDEAVEFGRADGVLDAGAGGEVGFGVGVNVAGLGGLGEEGFASHGGEDGFGSFEMAEVVGAVEEVVFSAGGRV